MAKSCQQIAALQVAQFFSAPTLPNFVQKCFVKWLFSLLSFVSKKMLDLISVVCSMLDWWIEILNYKDAIVK
jgi:hypothetical protein